MSTLERVGVKINYKTVTQKIFAVPSQFMG